MCVCVCMCGYHTYAEELVNKYSAAFAMMNDVALAFGLGCVASAFVIENLNKFGPKNPIIRALIGAAFPGYFIAVFS